MWMWMWTLWVLAAASLSSCDGAHFAVDGRQTGIAMVGSTMGWAVQMLIAKRLPFVRFVMGLNDVGKT
tara:strand:- start:2270 stop:2473 length:204 start_codon:yes stop_codon:yes gene_type:complete